MEVRAVFWPTWGITEVHVTLRSTWGGCDIATFPYFHYTNTPSPANVGPHGDIWYPPVNVGLTFGDYTISIQRGASTSSESSYSGFVLNFFLILLLGLIHLFGGFCCGLRFYSELPY